MGALPEPGFAVYPLITSLFISKHEMGGEVHGTFTDLTMIVGSTSDQLLLTKVLVQHLIVILIDIKAYSKYPIYRHTTSDPTKRDHFLLLAICFWHTNS